MALSKIEFSVLVALAEGCNSFSSIAERCSLAMGTVRNTFDDLKAKGYAADAIALTDKGKESLLPYKVSNAVIMAAGLSSRFAPLSYEKPKGVLRVRGEVLIERQIKQLHEAGIYDITVVVGYMKEAFFYLEDKYGVSIVVNEDYSRRNNNSTLMLVRDRLSNTYICSSDDYFTENVFEPYVYEAYYPGVFFEGPTEEYLMETDSSGRIVDVGVGGSDAYGMLGHVYFDRNFSDRFTEILETEYFLPETAPKLWEDIFREHLEELKMVMRPYPAGVIFEFDSLDDLRDFDEDFISNVDSRILDNICKVLECRRNEIHGIVPVKKGLTNLSFKFMVGDIGYVYRHPGVGTEAIINRKSEAFSQRIAKSLGVDDTFIYQDENSGWKISLFVEGCSQLDYHNREQVVQALSLVKKLHQSKKASEWSFSLPEKTVGLIDMLEQRAYPVPADFPGLKVTFQEIGELVALDDVEPCLCHNDFYAPNILVSESGIRLIDWEYSAMSDYASDLGTFICCSDYNYDEAMDVVSLYFDDDESLGDVRHCVAHIALAAFYWFVWAMYKESEGDPVGEWLYLWYKSAKLYSQKALELYSR